MMFLVLNCISSRGIPSEHGEARIALSRVQQDLGMTVLLGGENFTAGGLYRSGVGWIGESDEKIVVEAFSDAPLNLMYARNIQSGTIKSGTQVIWS